MMFNVVFIITIAFLGAYAGKEGTSLIWRRLITPSIATSYALYLHFTVASLAPLLWAIPLSMGYGLPDENDDGSFLGRIAVKISRKYADALVRGLIAVLLSIPLFILNPSKAIFPAILLITTWILFGGDAFIKNEGKIAGLLIEDLILYGMLGCSLVCVIG